MWKLWRWTRDLGGWFVAALIFIIVLCHFASCPNNAEGRKKSVQENHVVYWYFDGDCVSATEPAVGQELDKADSVEEIRDKACSSPNTYTHVQLALTARFCVWLCWVETMPWRGGEP